jgi:hypothetical protein
VIKKAMVKFYFWINFQHFHHETSHFTCHRCRRFWADQTLIQPVHCNPLVKTFVSNMKYRIVSSSSRKFVAEKGKGKGKVVPVLNLIKHYAMKVYGGTECVDPHFLDLYTRWR